MNFTDTFAAVRAADTGSAAVRAAMDRALAEIEAAGARYRLMSPTLQALGDLCRALDLLDAPEPWVKQLYRQVKEMAEQAARRKLGQEG